MTGQRILVVDDEPNIVGLVSAYLQHEGFAVRAAPTGSEALTLARTFQPHLVVLDLMLPGMDGLEVCRRLNQESSTYILMLTARSEEADKVIGLGLGADDYLTKPFSPKELVARVKAILRRDRSSREAGDRDSVLVFPSIVIDVARRTVLRDGAPVTLTQLEFDLLKVLASNPGVVLSRSQLLQRVWGYDFFGDERVVDVHIGLLRKKIETQPAAPALIKTVRGVGYKFEDTEGAVAGPAPAEGAR
ncbi:MAG: response regulator transcription factor [Chloroflexota bacterium]